MSMSVVVPDRTLSQRMRALEGANRVRSERAVLKRKLRAGGAGSVGSALVLLSDPPDWAATMRVWDVLIALPKFGRVKVNRVFRTAGVSPSRTLAGLSDRQRGVLVGLLRSGGLS